MSDHELLEAIRRSRRASIDFFSSRNKPEREKWVCRTFLRNLRITFEDADILSRDCDPPDVIFRKARFEIKEVLDPGRHRHDEYKAAHRKSLETTDPRELFALFTPKDITPCDLAEIVRIKTETLTHRYSQTDQLDLLFYVNLREHFSSPGPMPELRRFPGSGWRSISVVQGSRALVLFAAADAPDFLQSKVGVLCEGDCD